MSEIRYDLLHDEYALIAPERLHRPDCYRTLREEESADHRNCPFCPGHEAMTPPEIFSLRDGGDPNTPGWKTRVVPNLYKAVQIEAPWQSEEVGIYTLWEGLGAHEVIVDTPRHLTRMDGWSENEYFNWLYTLRSRVNDLRNDIRLVTISLFKNHGHYAAATQTHPHTQLIALPVVPKETVVQMERAKHYFDRRRHNIFESVLHQERSDAKRIVLESDRFIAFCPYASTFAFETAIFSKNGIVSVSDLDEPMMRELGGVLKQTIDALYEELGDFDFNILFNTPPLQKNSETETFYDDIPHIWRFGIRIVPRLFRLGGFELESGIQINPVLPEEAASLLKTALKALS
ncbi:galactose-1-phosphate uridylyltransferase [Hydrogenimonas sp. SS33]|uniref:galactose-1-phosphate uridylyltransferase n=1 Tax=Hydrogenimonas leucolamina TaxID=2954236 RepID=UPI00336BBD6B